MHDAIKAAVREFGGDDVAIEPLERFEFYDASREQPPVTPARQHSPCQEDEFIECAVWIYRGSVCGCSVWRGTQAVRERLVAKGLPLFLSVWLFLCVCLPHSLSPGCCCAVQKGVVGPDGKDLLP